MGIFSEKPEAIKYEIANNTVTCNHCGNDLFIKSKAQLNTAGMSFLGLDWLNENSNIFICEKCGQVMWFVDKD